MSTESWRLLSRDTKHRNWGLVAIVAIATALIASDRPLSGAQDLSTVAREIPGCDRPHVVQVLKGLIAGSSLAKSHNLVPLDVMFISEDQSSGAEKRICTATIVFTNVGNHQVTYTLEWIDAAKEKLRLQADPRILVA